MNDDLTLERSTLRASMRTLGIVCGLACLVAPVAAASRPEVLIVVGAAGEEEYAPGFTAAAEAWRKACEAGEASYTILGSEAMDVEAAVAETVPDKARLQAWIEALSGEGDQPVWIAYLGHGTFDGREARLNLRGPDVSAAELQTWLARLQRPLVFIHGGSASGPFLPVLSGPGRVVITATEAGTQVNYARFGEKFAEAVADPAADLDQDGQTTVLEAYLTAARRVQDFYTEELRMATEHALLDDNGDQRGTPPEWFRGTRATKKAEGGASTDGVKAHRIALVSSAAERALTPTQRAQRDRLEEELERLRADKEKRTERDYRRELEMVLRRLGAIYQAAPGTVPLESGPTEPPPRPAGDDRPPDS